MWDFGFLLCNERQWQQAAKGKISCKVPFRPGGSRTEEIFDRMVRWRPKRGGEERPGVAGGSAEVSVTWREFLQACQVVAKTEHMRSLRPSPVFDAATASPESLTCLLLEIWLSEIAEDIYTFRKLLDHWPEVDQLRDVHRDITNWLERAEGCLSRLSSSTYQPMDDSSFASLADMLTCDPGEFPSPGGPEQAIGGYWEKFNNEQKAALRRFFLVSGFSSKGYGLHLYQTWLLLVEVFSFEEYLDDKANFELRRNRVPDERAAATRHWYKTASLACNESREPLAPSRLPGRFSIRGDWFLAVAEGSRSDRLADLAVDVLSSRRANRTRLHLGLGLPVRDVVPTDDFGVMRTRMNVKSSDVLHDVLYRDLLAMGGKFLKGNENDSFFWGFRTGFANYDRQAVVVRRWIQRMFTWTIRFRFEQAWEWGGGFNAYDDLSEGKTCVVKGYASPHYFFAGLRALVADLKAAVPVSPSKGAPNSSPL
jgi:hypothetical protein